MTLPNFPQLDMFSTGINALHGVLVAGQPSHNRNYTVAGLLIMAFFGGSGGGVTRDVLLNDIPGPFRDPYYLLTCILMGLVGLAIYRYAATREERFCTRTMAFFKSFSLPWFAILGAHKALEHGLDRGRDRDWSDSHQCGRVADRPLLRRHAGYREAVGATRDSVRAGGRGLHAPWQLEKGRSFFPVTLIAMGVTFIFRVLAVREHFPSLIPKGCPPEGPEIVPLAAPAARRRPGA